MKRLNTYINEEIINDDILIIEGKFWNKLKTLFGFNKEKVAKTMDKCDDNTKLSFTTLQYVLAKTGISKKSPKEVELITKGAEEDPKALLKNIKLCAKNYSKIIDNLEVPEVPLAVNQVLKDLSDQLNDDEGKKMSEEFKKIIDEKWPNGGQKYENIFKKVKKSGQAENISNTNNEDNKDDSYDKKQDKSEEKSTLGNDEGELKSVTPKQETNAIKDEIKSNNDFYSPLAKAAGLDGQELLKGVQSLINKSWKKVEQDENGNAILKWKNPTMDITYKDGSTFEDHAIKGLSAILCGLLIINHKPLIKGIYSQIDPEGQSKEEIMKIFNIDKDK